MSESARLWGLRALRAGWYESVLPDVHRPLFSIYPRQAHIADENCALAVYAHKFLLMPEAPRGQVNLEAWVSGLHLEYLSRSHLLETGCRADDGLGAIETAAVERGIC